MKCALQCENTLTFFPNSCIIKLQTKTIAALIVDIAYRGGEIAKLTANPYPGNNPGERLVVLFFVGRHIGSGRLNIRMEPKEVITNKKYGASYKSYSIMQKAPKNLANPWSMIGVVELRSRNMARQSHTPEASQGEDRLCRKTDHL